MLGKKRETSWDHKRLRTSFNLFLIAVKTGKDHREKNHILLHITNKLAEFIYVTEENKTGDRWSFCL